MRWALSPWPIVLPRAAESWADPEAHQDPTSSQQPLCKAMSSAPQMPCTASEKLLPGHSPLLPLFPWDPALPFAPQELPWDTGNSRFPIGSTCPSHACPGKHRTKAGPRDTLGTAIPHGASPLEKGSGVGGEHAGGNPLPPGPCWPGTLCCWGSVPRTTRQIELSNKLFVQAVSHGLACPSRIPGW